METAPPNTTGWIPGESPGPQVAEYFAKSTLQGLLYVSGRGSNPVPATLKRYEVDGKGTNMIGFESNLSSLVKRYIY